MDIDTIGDGCGCQCLAQEPKAMLLIIVWVTLPAGIFTESRAFACDRKPGRHKMKKQTHRCSGTFFISVADGDVQVRSTDSLRTGLMWDGYKGYCPLVGGFGAGLNIGLSTSTNVFL